MGFDVAAVVHMGCFETNLQTLCWVVTQVCPNLKWPPPTLSIPVPHHLPHSICPAFVCYSFQRWGLNWLNAPFNLGPYTITYRIQVPCGWFPETSEHIPCFIYPSIPASSHSFTQPPTHPCTHIYLPPVLLSVCPVIHSTSIHHVPGTERI